MGSVKQINIKVDHSSTITAFNSVIAECKAMFMAKTTDYGTAWRVLRMSSLTDQIYIKAQRIRTIEEKQVNLVGESVELEYIGIINYCVMAIIQLQLPPEAPLELPPNVISDAYDAVINEAVTLLQQKNHDYGEAWRQMRVTSFTDLILMKLVRVKQIEDNAGKTIISEGQAANYQDMINYAVFALIRYNNDDAKN